MTGTPAAVPTPQESWLRSYIAAVHVGRIGIGIAAVVVACMTYDEIPTDVPYTIILSVIALAWVVGVAAFSGPLWRLLSRRPQLIWVDTAVLVGLMLVDRPVDSLVAIPYGAFGLMVPFVRPRLLAAAVATTIVLGYMPRLVAEAVGWRFSDLVPPTSTVEWVTIAVGPLFAGSVAVALCVLMYGVREATAARVAAQEAEAVARVERARLATRAAVANEVHTAVSNLARGIDLRLAGDPPDGLGADALAVRADAIATARELRPALAAMAGDIRSGA